MINYIHQHQKVLELKLCETKLRDERSNTNAICSKEQLILSINKNLFGTEERGPHLFKQNEQTRFEKRDPQCRFSYINALCINHCLNKRKRTLLFDIID